MSRCYNKNYLKKLLDNPLPALKEDERIYLNATYQTNSFAKTTHCGFDAVKKLWFTGIHNTFIKELVELYGINKATSEKAISMLNEKLISLSQNDVD